MSLKDFSTDDAGLKEEIIEKLQLLEPYKVLLDRVWDRIWLTELEISLVDTEPFQRLHWKLQLGSTIFVYPCASHTRFEHSIGTLQGVERIIQACKMNEQRYPNARGISLYEHFLARLAALLHDVAQMAYGHTLKDEGHVMQVEWKCRIVHQKLISPDGIIPKIMLKHLKKVWSRLSLGAPRKITVEEFVEFVRRDLEWILTIGISEPGKRPPNEYLPFISDIVGNTLSGDLLDYAQRDYVSLGIDSQGISLLPLEFVIIREVTIDNVRAPRLVLTLWKPSKPEKMRKDVVRLLVDLFDQRCRLAENVYFHHAKIAASAMLIKAVDLSGLTCEQLWEYSDAALLEKLAQWKTSKKRDEQAERIDIVKSLAKKLKKRHFFKNVYECNFAELRARHQPELLHGYCTGDKPDEKQREFEKTLRSYFPGISDDQLAIYCPDPDMNLKPFKTLVWPTSNQDIVALKDVSRIDVASIEGRHRDLWGITVFVDPDVLTEERFAQLQTACQSILFGKKPEYPLATIWVENHGIQLKGRVEGIELSQVMEAKKVVANLLKENKVRHRGEVTGLVAPTVEKVASLLSTEGAT